MSENGKDILSGTLITGASGTVGGYVDFGIKLDHRALDVTDLNETVKTVEKYMPKVIIHLAAETDVDRCDRDPQHAYMVNSIATYNVATAAKKVGAKLVYVSTSAIFNGLKKEPYEEFDEPDPQGYYGRSKFLGEIFVKELLKDYIIARICWVFGGGPNKDQKFVAKIIKQMDQQEIKIISDKYGSPTYGKDLVAALKKLIIENASGVFHLSNSGSPSRLAVAEEIKKVTNSQTVITPVDESYFSKVYTDKRPNNESMSSRIDIMRPWKEALREYLENEWDVQIKKSTN